VMVKWCAGTPTNKQDKQQPTTSKPHGC